MQTSQTSTVEVPPIGEQGFRLSYQQRRIWQQARGAEVLYARCLLRLEGELDAVRVRLALHDIVQRHDMLRTTFPRPAGMSLPVQAIAGTGRVEWRELEHLEDLNQPFSLAEGPVLRAALVRIAATQHLLVLTLPALCADAATLHNLAQEVRDGYGGQREGDSIQYVQLSEWQQSLQEEADAEQGRQYWRAQKPVAPLVLPLHRVPREARAFCPASSDVVIPRRFGRVEREDACLLGCWMTLLWRVTGQSSLCAGVTCHGRAYEELQGALGPVARVVPLNCTVREGLPFNELLRTLAASSDEAGDWQEYYERGDGDAFEPIGFEYNEWAPLEPAAGVRFGFVSQQAPSDRFYLKLSCTRAGDCFTARLEYDPRVLAAAYVERLTAQFATLLDAAWRRPETLVEQLPILGDEERRFVLEECNDTAAAYPQAACVHHLFAEQAARTPDRIAISFGGANLTYRELDQRANQLAHRLRELNVGPEVRVGIFLHRSLEMMVGLLAILKAGGAYVPFEPAYPEARLAFMLTDSQVAVLLTEHSLRHRAPAGGAHVLCIDEPLQQVAGTQPDYQPSSGVRAENLAYALYTSGSTGQPKGALITHRSLVNYLSWCCSAYAIESGTGTAVHSSIGFDATITGLFPPLLAGRTVMLLPEAEGVDGLPQAMQRGDAFSLIKITPAHLSLLNDAVTGGDLANKTRALVIGGDALLGGRLSAWRKHSPQTRLINEYGPTETVVGCCVHEATEADLAEESVPIGRAIANTQLYILDSRLLPLPTGIPGELFIGGDGVCRGYLGRPALTAERFLPDEFSGRAGGRVYRTGDLTIRRPDGVLGFLGRLDHQVKIRSYRIELGEIETQLEQHAGVARSVVIAPAQSSGEKSLIAYVQPRGAKAPEADELRSFLLNKLPEHMVPSIFVELAALPLTAHGKVDRNALPDPDTLHTAARNDYAAPTNQAEETLAAIWREVLRVERVGIHDDFFRSGGDSILSILVVARAAKAGMRFTTRELFQHPTIAELASKATVTKALLEQGAGKAAIDGPVPLTPIQQWFFERRLPEPDHFNQAVLLQVQSELRIDLLRRVVDELVTHHDALRLRFTQETEGWRQTHASAENAAAVSEVDLTQIPNADRETALAAHANEAQAGLHLSEGPLLRAVLFRFGGGAPSRLLLVAHHLVIDGVSWRILLDDFATAYQALNSGDPIRLPPKTTSFQHWALRLQEYSGSEALAREEDYWLRMARTPSLPSDFPLRPEANTVGSAARVRVALDRRQTAALLHEVSGVYRTRIDDLLLTALAQASARWTGSRSLLIDLEGHGREELFTDVDISRTVGWFTSVFPVQLQLSDRGPGDELKAIKEQLRGVPQHGVGYGILRYLGLDAGLRARLAGMPRPQMSFNYLGQLDGLAAEPILAVASEAPGAESAPGGRRLYLLDVIGEVAEGCLQMELVYSTAVHRRATVESLARDIIASLELLVAHCLSSDAGGVTASDFPEAGLSQEELEGLVADLE